jgi:hypothetical protein
MSLVLSGVLSSLLHLDPQQVGLGTAGCFGVIAALLVEGIAALVQRVDLCLAFFLFVGVFR